MTMPGFTAEASLTNSKAPYRSTPNQTPRSKQEKIIPQRRVIWEGRVYECTLSGRCKLIGWLA
jgi:hypothetical protein